MAKDDAASFLGKPEVVGKFPEPPPPLQVIPADAEGTPPIGFTVREYMGTLLYKAPPESQMPLDWDAWHAYMQDLSNIWTLDDPDPKEGDRVLVQGLCGLHTSIVETDGYGGIHATSGGSVWFLCRSTEQEGDDRNAWVVSGGANLKAIKRLKIFSEGTSDDEENGKAI